MQPGRPHKSAWPSVWPFQRSAEIRAERAERSDGEERRPLGDQQRARLELQAGLSRRRCQSHSGELYQLPRHAKVLEPRRARPHQVLKRNTPKSDEVLKRNTPKSDEVP